MITDYFMITEKSNRLQVIMITDYDYPISGTCKHEKRITLIMNKMLVAFAFRPLAVFIHAFLHK